MVMVFFVLLFNFVACFVCLGIFYVCEMSISKCLAWLFAFCLPTRKCCVRAVCVYVYVYVCVACVDVLISVEYFDSNRKLYFLKWSFVFVFDYYDTGVFFKCNGDIVHSLNSEKLTKSMEHELWSIYKS